MRTSRILLGVTVAMLCDVGPAFAVISHNLTVRLSGAHGGDCAAGAACDTNSLQNAVTFSSSVVPPVSPPLVATGSTGSGPFDLNLHYTVNGNDPTIQVSENNLSGSGLSWTAVVTGIQNNTTTTNWSFFADTSNTLFGTGTLICSGSSGATSFSKTCSDRLSAFSGTLFSLTQVITVTNLTLPLADGDVSLKAAPVGGPVGVPEPGTLLLLGSGLAIAGMWGGRGAFRKREK